MDNMYCFVLGMVIYTSSDIDGGLHKTVMKLWHEFAIASQIFIWIIHRTLIRLNVSLINK